MKKPLRSSLYESGFSFGAIVRASTLSCCVFAVSSQVSADTSNLAPIIVTASRTNDADTLLIEKEELRVDTLSAIDRLPGITAYNNGGAGGSSFVSERGGEPNFTLVLIDGIRQNDSTNSAGGSFDFGQIEPALIDQVRVKRSATSAIHGADALSGVISILSPSPRAQHAHQFSAGASVNSENGYAINASATYGFDTGGLSIGAATRDTGELTGDSQLKRDAVLVRWDQDFAAGKLSATAYHAETDREAYAEDSGGILAPLGPVIETRDTTIDLFGLRYSQPLSGNISISGHLNYSDQSSFADIPAIPGGVFDPVPARIDDTRLKRWEALAALTYRPHPGLETVFGGGYINERGEGDGLLDLGFPLETEFSEKRDVLSVFIENSLSLGPRIDLNSAARVDKPDDRSAELTYKVAGQARLSEEWQLNGAVESGYKLPSIFAIAYPLIANPDLEPETGTSVQVGAQLNSDSIGRLSVSVHATRFRNLVDFDPEAFTNVNRRQVDSRGLELEWSNQITKRTRALAYVSLNDTDSSSEQPLRNRPDFSASTRFDFQLGEGWAAYAAWRYSSEFFTSPIPTGFIELGGFDQLDVGVAWIPAADWTFKADLTNGFDSNISYAYGMEEPKRFLTLSLSKTLRGR